MNRFSFIINCALAIALTFSCVKPSSDNNSEAKDTIGLSAAELSFEYEGGSKELEFTASGDWTFSSQDASWCTVAPSSGTGSGKVTVTVSEYSGAEEPRATTVTLSCGGSTAIATVTQTANPDSFSVSPKSFEIGPEGKNFVVIVKYGSHEYDVTIVDEWISIVSRMKHDGTESITFHADQYAPTEDGEPRTGIVSICTKEGTCIPVMVTQAGRKLNASVLGMRFTATWCGYCPYMDEGFHKAAEQNEDFLFVTFHASSGYPLYFSSVAPLTSRYKVSGFPTGVIGGWMELDNTTDSNSLAGSVVRMVTDFQSKFGRSVLITPSLTVTGNNVNASATIESKEDSELKVVAILMESGIVQSQTFYPTTGGSTTLKDFVHDNIARQLLTGSILGDSFTLGAGESKSFSWDTVANNTWNKENLSVVVYVYKDYGDKASFKAQSNYPDNYIANAAIASADN